MLKLLMTATAVASIVATPAYAGNGAPSGPHYSLNIIGMDKEKQNMTGGAGHVIFVSLGRNGAVERTKINLEMGDFDVIDRDGTDGEATFQLPAPDTDFDGITAYSVFVRGLGKPGGKANMQTCATDPDVADDPNTPDDESLVCSADADTEADILIEAHGNNNKFSNVSKYLLYVSVDLDGDGDVERVPLFDSALEDYYWEYDNQGLRLAQLRFYECSTAAWDDEDVVGESPPQTENEPPACTVTGR